MSNIKAEEGVNEADIEQISGKRLVFIIDEAHRTTFGDMLLTIKHTFPNAIFFGFTGTPIEEKTLRKIQPLPRFSAMNCTAIPSQTVFVMKTCWAFTPSISAPLKTAIYAEPLLYRRQKQ